MKTDLYTKIVLTVIAVALVANFFKSNDVVSSAYASSAGNVREISAPQREVIDVNIVSVSKPVDVNLTQYTGYDLFKFSDGYENRHRFSNSNTLYYIPISLDGKYK
ncbi:hypothetical protein [Dysgonomonas sp. Marseille-P4361]|uniref:hypothetical protein n=1 Tax=Dysgonomonas sp. Marseille-P4361 TaxID=2161820 RepID=UPI000D557070|nr:hypothetical protein [Dysgonomonas sp. Marseille-P4361]